MYRLLGISKQAVYQSKQRQIKFDLELMELVYQADQIRTAHPGCGVEKLYWILKPEYMGRDKFCEIFMDLGYRVRHIKNYVRTTIPTHLNYPNLIENTVVRAPYRIIQSDITYFHLAGEFYYLVFIIDVYTREILGYHVGDSLRAECNVKALKMALRNIPTKEYSKLIHHSDRRSQYGSNIYIRLLKSKNIKVSMGYIAQDNAYVERVNGTIKNEYLNHWFIKDFKDLKRLTTKAVKHYNSQRVHLAFKNQYSPIEFRNNFINLKLEQRPFWAIPKLNE